jgi:NADH dehydrogenase
MILVTGALGLVGRPLVTALLESGLSVRVLVPQRWQRRLPWLDSRLEVYPGTLFDPETLYRAMSGVHTIIHLASAQWWGGPRDLEYVDLEGTKKVLEAGRSARVGRVIVLSHIGAEPASGFALLRVKGQMEQAVKNSGLAYTILRCGILFGPEDDFVNHLAMALRSNPFFIFQPGAGESLLNPLYVDDLVAAVVRSLELLELVDSTLEIGGAEYMTFHELLRTVMRVSRCQRTIVEFPPYLLRSWAALWRLIPFIRFPITPQWYDILAGNRTAELGNLYNYTGVRPHRFEDTLLTYMPQRYYGLEYLRFMFSRRKRSAF